MNLPGFSAENSLSTSTSWYGLVEPPQPGASAEVIPQQFCRRMGNYTCCCYQGFCNCFRTGGLPQ